MESVEKATKKFSPEMRERAVWLVLEQQREHESQWAAINSVAAKIGCSGETLRKWVWQAERTGAAISAHPQSSPFLLSTA